MVQQIASFQIKCSKPNGPKKASGVRLHSEKEESAHIQQTVDAGYEFEFVSEGDAQEGGTLDSTGCPPVWHRTRLHVGIRTDELARRHSGPSGFSDKRK